MREIKFRAWALSSDGETRRMLSPETVEINFYEFNQDKDIELMQYTGLKDKNGVEIYEGDLLRLTPENDWDKNNYSSFEVFFHDNDCTPTDCGLVLGRMKNYGSVAGGFCGYKLTPRDVEKMIVIGNIYENPELMEGDSK